MQQQRAKTMTNKRRKKRNAHKPDYSALIRLPSSKEPLAIAPYCLGDGPVELREADENDRIGFEAEPENNQVIRGLYPSEVNFFRPWYCGHVILRRGSDGVIRKWVFASLLTITGWHGAAVEGIDRLIARNTPSPRRGFG